MKPRLILLALLLSVCLPAYSTEFHVAVNGDNANPGARKSPFRTIQHAADVAQPGDTITVHEGVYRERINPPRGGQSDKRRITYRAASGERVEIKGSELVTGWQKVKDDVWKVTLPNSFFGAFNPFAEMIHGDWFDPRGRKHHRGAVYLNGDWLTEAASLDEVLLPGGAKPAWLNGSQPQYLVNIAWLRVGGDKSKKIPAAGFAARQGTQNAPCSEGGECLGYITQGDWVRYDGVDLSNGGQIEIRAAAPGEGALIEMRLDTPSGELIGACDAKPTGDWQQWASFSVSVKPIGGTRNLCLVFKSRKSDAVFDRGLNRNLWFAQVDASNTTILAQFAGVNPNNETVEVNVREAVFYPDKPGRNYITVRGFIMRQAATQWAPPTSEQIGLIGTHWSRGWIIENNTISHSICSGIALGKHGDQYDNTSADTAEGYVKTIERAHAFPIPWTRESIGHHIVRNNTISHCEQTGIVGSLGAAFSTVSGNTIHDIHVRRLFSGAEMAGIKFHGAIDTTISHNHIYHCCQALWLDWMAQGTRVTANLFHDNEDRDVFLEVNHGPHLLDNNVLLSHVNLLDVSEGGAFVHNLFAGKLISSPELNRETPYHPAHSTTVAGLSKIEGGGDRFYNNIFVGNGSNPGQSQGDLKDPHGAGGFGLWAYDFRACPPQTGGNVFYNGALPYAHEQNPLVLAGFDPAIKLSLRNGTPELQINLPERPGRVPFPVVTTEALGKPRISNVAYDNPDGSSLKVRTDIFGHSRRKSNPTPGPFEKPKDLLQIK